MTLEDILYNVQSFFMDKPMTKELSLNQFNYYLKMASNELWKSKIGYPKNPDGYATKKQISEALSRYMVFAAGFPLSSGIATLTIGASSRVISAFYTSGSDVYPIDIVESSEYMDRVINAVNKPSLTYPVARIGENASSGNPKIYVYPTSITVVYVDYIKIPTTPALALKLENGIMVYDSALSVELDWDEEYHADILKLILRYIGVPDQDITTFSNEIIAQS